MTESSDNIEILFNEITATGEFDTNTLLQRIHAAAKDEALVKAVYDECKARIASLPFLPAEISDENDRRCDEALAEVARVAAHLQHEYGLDDESILTAIELARVDIQKLKNICD